MKLQFFEEMKSNPCGEELPTNPRIERKEGSPSMDNLKKFLIVDSTNEYFSEWCVKCN